MTRRLAVMLIVLVILFTTGSGVAVAEESFSAEAGFQITATIVSDAIEIIPEDIDFGYIEDLSTDHAAEPATFTVTGSDLEYVIELEEEVELTNETGDVLKVVLNAPKEGVISDGEDSFSVEALLQANEEVSDGSYTGSSTITVQYAN